MDETRLCRPSSVEVDMVLAASVVRRDSLGDIRVSSRPVHEHSLLTGDLDVRGND